MSRLGFKSLVYHADSCLGEVDVFPPKNQEFQFPNNEIRIHHFSPSSERCPPLSVLQTISPFAVRCKLEAKVLVEQSPLIDLHSSCFHQFKTAVVLLGNEELHLVPMLSKQKIPCFWCCSVSLGLYDSCLGMLNLRCLAIVFDLDETLIVANTMKSFEDRIEALHRRLDIEIDPLRISGMSAELRRYVEDRALLKQYTESDIVNDNGVLLKVQAEEVHPPSDNHERIVRPVIRLQEKNIVLTRINPEIRDTSVLVRLRPAWEDLRSYLTAKGRKRFEVYVCTMAERDYALEIWRLLDPEAHLISSKELLNRIVCVKSGSRKSLLNVFQDGFCHPKMAMVIDDRLKVWEDKDQPRVHVVPAFTPYYAPQAETANAVPVLCVARNVACNVRGGFFKEFDENLLRRISEVRYEDEVVNLPSAPDVSNYLMSEDAGFVLNGNRDVPISEGMSGSEVEHRLNRPDEKGIMGPTPFSIYNPGAVARREVNSSELDPDTRRRLLILQHGQDMRDQDVGNISLLSRPSAQISGPSVQPRGGWLIEEDTTKEQYNNRPSGSTQEPDVLQSNKQRVLQNPLCQSTENSVPSGLPSHVFQVKNEEAHLGHERQKQNQLLSNQSLLSEKDGVCPSQASISNREHQVEAGKVSLLPPSISIRVLYEIGRKCHSKVEFRSVVSTSKDLQFCVEVLFTGEKIGVGMGKTKKDAQKQAAENALHSLADKYIEYIAPGSGAVDRDLDKLSIGNENGFLWDIVDPELKEPSTEDTMQNASTSEAADGELLSATSVVNQQAQKRANSPRSPQTIQSKRSKEELLRGLQGLSSSRYQKNGHPVS